MFIRTERLFLRPVFPEDWRAVHAAIADERIVRMLACVPWPYGEAEAQRFCAEEDGACRFAITLPGRKGAALIGMIGLRDESEGLELGYWIARPYWGQGFAVEAGQGVLDTARALGRHRILAGHYLDNPASGRVLEKLGFIRTGEIRPTFCQGRGGEMVLARRYALQAAEPTGSDAGVVASA
ncbi:RimJ/RimL family protein N-acetyltransferase [Altererythrobacter atlanticus]|uniref:Uncharacterized protein n=1 Tax=Croceibacterium atlanticum TaxID=1267766 RepID=A0A0F7KRT0_9SPHN|nr:GNAT family N-acetyltransferase [Croceibacterium atlanticum]AKH42309.1 hypothetical protein WYH_01264 [Croceibacterium atlanticum]MBB5731086.1 RimJ/RimL family protein N-acetyltransferase [Croceibacterium atlanticum]